MYRTTITHVPPTTTFLSLALWGCDSKLSAAFTATGDWCEEHELPESKGLICNPELKLERPPAIRRAHTMSVLQAGMQLLGFLLIVGALSACSDRGKPREAPVQTASAPSEQAAARCEHGLPSALCTKCNPALAVVFQAKGDWCPEHGFPESFCPICNPGASFPNVGTPPAAAANDWCAGHGLPESMCTKCNPELTALFQEAGDWCEEHGFPESACPVCNPQSPPGGANQPVADWCVEHGLPESKCTKCNPALLPKYRAAGDYCEEHGFPESVCPVCQPQEPPTGAEQAAIEARVVRFRSPDIERVAGIETVAAKRGRASATIDCTARIAFDNDRVADVRALVPGIVRRVRAELGAVVKRGDALFELESTQVGELQGALQTARVNLRTAKSNVDRLRELRAGDVISARNLELAEQEFAAAQSEARTAEATLKVAGAARSAPSGRYTLAAPIKGTLVRRPAVLGLLATSTESLAMVADTSVMWALCDVPETYASRVAVGQRVTVSVDGADFAPIEGELTWVASEVDVRTRTVSARADIPNADGALRANQFARARIQTGAPRSAVSVPRGAVQRVGKREVVFVRTSAGVYEPRVVQRHGDDDPVLVQGRVEADDAVVTTGAVLLRTEIMPGSIGAGCCEVEPPGAE